jgi:hypothetical protein
MSLINQFFIFFFFFALLLLLPFRKWICIEKQQQKKLITIVTGISGIRCIKEQKEGQLRPPAVII